MDVEILDFDSALAVARANQAQLSVLLGNGFSQAYSAKFAYRRLRDVTEMEELSVAKDSLFAHVGSDDFETVIDHLQRSARLVDLYSPKSVELRKSLENDARVVKRGLVDALTAVHPSLASEIEVEQYRSARAFLTNFKRIFTVNYDLLLYWAINQKSLEFTVQQRDGFNRVDGILTWQLPDDSAAMEIFYLHGAMHLYIQDRKARKLEYRNGNLIDQLRLNLQNRKYPLVVTEGSREDKEARISRSAYLRYCHRRLRRLTGVLFVHGWALSDNDGHMLEALTMKENRVDSIFVGLHGQDSDARDAVIMKSHALVRQRNANSERPLNLHFYDSASSRVWERHPNC
ncbi:DUF4917 family protein [Mycobacteroides abscessus]|uniref:DUF4917 family protein n=1 Tax=Mycobacteroides abscessus TaxID=36809 RepID=UPI00232FA78E|nr:DUF4917 family protein [Mycobacteroides abscessus]MDB2210891.1 DUF4917 family protein [Mycobacteroides abscessus subsp. massiliense]MDB2233972.1 DUF4917 family protein [Mycobacteroides abscessus subsp. massiliense]